MTVLKTKTDPDVVEELEAGNETLTSLLPSEILSLASDLIKQSGWTTGGPYCEGEGYCMGGAIAQLAVGDPNGMYYDHEYDLAAIPEPTPELKKAMQYVKEVLPQRYQQVERVSSGIYHYNDFPNRQEGQIHDILNQAACRAQANGE